MIGPAIYLRPSFPDTQAPSIITTDYDSTASLTPTSRNPGPRRNPGLGYRQLSKCLAWRRAPVFWFVAEKVSLAIVLAGQD
jgi:hypothetical protein